MKLKDKLVLSLLFEDPGFIIDSNYKIPMSYDFLKLYSKLSRAYPDISDIKENIANDEFNNKLLNLLSLSKSELMCKANDMFDGIMQKYKALEFIKFPIAPEEVTYSQFTMDDRIIRVPNGKTKQYTIVVKDILDNIYKAPKGNYGYVQGKSYDLIPAIVCKYRYIMKLDIKRFFDSISKDVLTNALVSKGLSEYGVSEIIKIIYGSGEAFPTGSNISPVVANLLLEGLDKKFGRSEDKNTYCRYSDDITLGSDSMHEILSMSHTIKEWLLYHKLKLNLEKVQLYDTDKEVAIVFSHKIYKRNIIGIADYKREEYLEKMKLENVQSEESRNGIIESMRKWSTTKDKDYIIDNSPAFIEFNEYRFITPFANQSKLQKPKLEARPYIYYTDDKKFIHECSVSHLLEIYKAINKETGINSISTIEYSKLMYIILSSLNAFLYKNKNLGYSFEELVLIFIDSDFMTELIEDYLNINNNLNYTGLFRYYLLARRPLSRDIKACSKILKKVFSNKIIDSSKRGTITTENVNCFSISTDESYDESPAIDSLVIKEDVYKNINEVVRTEMKNSDMKKYILRGSDFDVIRNFEIVEALFSESKKAINNFKLFTDDVNFINFSYDLTDRVKAFFDSVTCITLDEKMFSSCDNGIYHVLGCEKLKIQNKDMNILSMDKCNENLEIGLNNVSRDTNGNLTIALSDRYYKNKDNLLGMRTDYINAYTQYYSLRAPDGNVAKCYFPVYSIHNVNMNTNVLRIKGSIPEYSQQKGKVTGTVTDVNISYNEYFIYFMNIIMELQDIYECFIGHLSISKSKNNKEEINEGGKK